jgi:hypothetical protein
MRNLVSHAGRIERVLDARQPTTLAALRPDSDAVRQARPDRCDRVDQAGADDHMLWRDDRDRVPERFPDEIGVEQRGDPADPDDPEPDRQVLRAVRHHQRDDVAGADPLTQRPARIAPRLFGERAIAEAFRVGEQRRRVAVSFRGGIEGIGQGMRRVAGDRRGQLQRATPCLRRRAGAAGRRAACLARFDQCHPQSLSLDGSSISAKFREVVNRPSRCDR